MDVVWKFQLLQGADFGLPILGAIAFIVARFSLLAALSFGPMFSACIPPGRRRRAADTANVPRACGPPP
jgi:hypothetical protein